jgi:hypothetical protein
MLCSVVEVKCSCLFGLKFSPEDGPNTFLRNISKTVPANTTSHKAAPAVRTSDFTWIFLFFTASLRDTSHHLASYSKGTGGYSLREPLGTSNWPLTSNFCRIRNAWSYIPLPTHVFMAFCLMQREHFSVTMRMASEIYAEWLNYLQHKTWLHPKTRVIHRRKPWQPDWE